MLLLHTADWRLGALPDGDARLGARRFRAVHALAALAHARGVTAVVVCGDLFADLDVSDATLDRAAEALATFAPIPVLLIPGERDPFEPVGAWVRLAARRREGAGWQVASRPGAYPVGPITVLAAPRPYGGCLDDLTAPLDPAACAAPTVVAAHGGVRGGPPAEEAAHRVDVARLLAAGAAWVALGGTHTPASGPGWALPGTPEPWREAPAGGAVLVDLSASPPAGESVSVSPTRHLHRTITLPDPALDDPALADPDTHLHLVLAGTPSLTARAALDARLDALRAVALSLDVRDDTSLSSNPELGDDAPPPVREALATLLRHPSDHLAARLLHRLATEGR